MMKILGGIVAVILVGLAATYWFVCPCSYVPGGPLRGEVAMQPVEDWSFVNDRDAVPLCQIEVDFPVPRSMNVNCMSMKDRLFVSCSGCADKAWSAQALHSPAGYVRAAGVVYPITYQRITDETELDQVWSARLNKIGSDPTPRPDHWWSFELISG